LMRNKTRGWWDADGTLTNLVHHEFGHMVDNYLSTLDTKGVAPFDSETASKNRVSAVVARWKKRNKATTDLSWYATTNEKEGFACGFEALHSQSDHGRSQPYVKQLKKLLDTVYHRPLYDYSEQE